MSDQPKARPQAVPETEPPPFVRLEGITRRFPGIVANDAIDLSIRPGEVHVLLGENGAGKSTLVSMLSGLLQPDDGRILIDGVPTRINSPRAALGLGIGTVFQHMMLVPTLTVGENLALGGPWWQRPPVRRIADEVEAITRNLGMSINLQARVSELSLGEQQQIEIVRALMRHSRVLILDESTSMLPPSGIEELGALMRRLVGQGLAIVFITHKLKEAAAFGDRISVLKLGRKVGEIAPERLGRMDEGQLVSEVVQMMFGQDRENRVAPRVHSVRIDAPPLLSVRALALPASGDAPALHDISFEVRPGEIFGIAGIDGNGQKQLAETLAGQHAAAGGSVTLAGVPLDAMGVGPRHRKGLRYLTDDRLGEGTVGAFPVTTNYVLKQIGTAPFWRSGLERSAEITAHAERLTREFDVRTPSLASPVGRLSGGNIQKVILARELADGARAVIFNKATYGLDLANTMAARDRIREIAAKGIAVVLISTDLDELLDLSDRIAVMSSGRLVGTVENSGDATARIGRMMIGIAA